MRRYKVKLTGVTPMIVHADNVEWADQMDDWKNDPSNKKLSKAGDDRSPAFRWIGALHHEDGLAVIPSANLSRCFMEGGAMVLVPGGKRGKTFKSQMMSGSRVATTSTPILVNGKAVDVSKIIKMTDESDFGKHQEAAREAGFSLFVKRAAIRNSKHVRVRPRFNSWGCEFEMHVWDDQITGDILESVISLAGAYKGLCDWRPGGKTPGPFGTFSAEIPEA